MLVREIELTHWGFDVIDATYYTIGSDLNLLQIAAISFRLGHSTVKKRIRVCLSPKLQVLQNITSRRTLYYA